MIRLSNTVTENQRNEKFPISCVQRIFGDQPTFIHAPDDRGFSSVD